jgi:ATP-dependent Clp protease ATP-binding subunit ClpA
VFERFTPRARQVVVLAQEEARALQHGYIGTEHLLLGLLREEEGVAAQVLGSLGVTIEAARARVLLIVGSGEEASGGQIPFTPRAKKVLELALRESKSLGHNDIGTEHILLGVVREGEGVAARVLLEFDADAEQVRNEVIRALSASGARRGRARLIRSEVTGAAWIGELHSVLEPLEYDIRDALRRSPDSGDLLLALACARQTLAGRALAELGIDLDAFWGTVERVRTELREARAELERQAEEARQAKEAAIEAQDFQRAAGFRDQEREFSQRMRRLDGAGPEALRELRHRLGLPDPPEAAESL